MRASRKKHLFGLVSACAVLALASATGAQVTLDQIRSPSSAAPAPPAPAQPILPAARAPSSMRIPEGTEVHLRLAEKLSSSANTEGDTFEVTSDDEITLPDGATIPAGYSGRGEVTQAEKSGMLGKSGRLTLRINYLKIGPVHVHLRANKGGEGKSGTTNMIVGVVFLGLPGLIIRGHNMVYPKGTPVTAYVDEDAVVPVPLPPPPRGDD
ncbi:MAG: hypothetical protein ACREEB_01430 [Caulobacteraceae bacterium]